MAQNIRDVCLTERWCYFRLFNMYLGPPTLKPAPNLVNISRSQGQRPTMQVNVHSFSFSNDLISMFACCTSQLSKNRNLLHFLSENYLATITN